MQLIFLDDSKQESPTRQKAGPLIALGGLAIDSEILTSLNSKIDAVCVRFGFPENEPFKWSPGKDLWMHKGLIGEKRALFIDEILALSFEFKVTGFFVSVDTKTAYADKKSKSNQEDVFHLTIERIENYLVERNSSGIIIIDRTTGDTRSEERFLGNLIEKTSIGTSFVRPKQIAIPILSCPSRLCRPLQLADIFTSSTLARIAGENKYSPPVVNKLKAMLYSRHGRIGGFGAKLHPARKYANLYHWVFGDSDIWHNSRSHVAPHPGIAFSSSESVY